ncbi:hypothetical protein, partial [Zooshikella harenae]
MYKFSDVEHSDGVTSLILSPLPIWTGYKAADPLNVLTKKNDVFIDIGSGNAKEAFEVLHGAFSLVCIGFFFIYILFVTLIEPQHGFLNWDIIIITASGIVFAFCMCTSYVIIGHIQHGKENMQTRFNRQRREVAWVDDKKQLHLVPWESFKAWVST